MPLTLEWPLDLPDVRVLANRVLEDGTRLIEVERPVPTAPCPRGGREIDRFHGADRALRLQHLPVFGREGRIASRPKRYRCPHGDGGPTTTQRCDWDDPNRPHTKAVEAWVLNLLVHSTVAAVSRRLDLGVKAVEGLMAYHLTPRGDWAAFTVLETRGIDDVARCKGQGHDVAVVWARDAVADTHVLAGRPNRLQATVQACLDTRPAALKTTVRQVCIDRWEGYASAVAAPRPAAEVVVARCPVAVQSRQAVDNLRQQEGRRLNAGRPADQGLPTAELRSLRRREWSSLNRAQQDPLGNRFPQAPTLASAYRRRTLWPAIFEGTPARVTAQPRLPRWGAPVTAAGITCFEKCLTPLPHWQEGILNYFHNRQKSGFGEGLNKKRKWLTRRGFGRDNPTTLFPRLWLDIAGARQWF